MSHPHPPTVGFGPPGGGGYTPPPGGWGPPGGAPPGGGPPGGGPPGGGPPGGFGGGGFGGPPGGGPPGGFGGPPGGGGFGGPPPGGYGPPPGGFGAPAGPGWGAPGGPPGGFGHGGFGHGGPPPQKSNTPLIIGIIAGIVLLCGAGSVVAYLVSSRVADLAEVDDRKARDDGDRSKSKKASDEDDDDATTPTKSGKTLRARDGNSQVSVPDAWRELSNLNDEAKLEAGNPVLEEYLIVLTEAKADFAVPITLDRYADINLGTMRRVVKGAQVSSPKRLTINGLAAVQYEVRGTVDLLNIVYLVTYVEGKKNVHQVVSWTLGSKYGSNKSRFEQVAKSFQEI